MQANLAKTAAVMGIAGAAWVVGLTIIGGAMTPGYDHGTQFISELGAKGAPAALLALSRAATRWPGATMLSVLGIASAVGALAGFLAMLSPEYGYTGFAQRVLESSVLIWVVSCSFYCAAAGRRAS